MKSYPKCKSNMDFHQTKWQKMPPAILS